MASNSQLSVVCANCHEPVAASVRGEAVWDGREGEDLVNPPVEWRLIQCTNCWQPSVLVREDYGRGFDDDDSVVVYPAPPQISRNVPQPLRREWEEARICLEAKAYTACGVMVRRTLEGTCKDQGVKAKTLARGLQELRDKELVDGTLAEWADALRVLGNKSAHFTGTELSRDDAEDSLAFAEALLDHLYVLRKRFAEFKSRIDT
ncbi:MAG: DUF4145 domain-containing protein [Actinobacteria bacterium]|nr:DUF4145 domain-containing protein [Actinomycetota bacterium]